MIEFKRSSLLSSKPIGRVLINPKEIMAVIEIFPETKVMLTNGKTIRLWEYYNHVKKAIEETVSS